MKKGINILLAVIILFVTVSVSHAKNNYTLMAITPRSIDDRAVFAQAFPAVPKPPTTSLEYEKSKEAIVGELANHDVDVRVYSVESDGSLTLGPSIVAAKSKKIIVQQDYANYKIVEHEGKLRKVGVLFRVEAKLVTKSRNVNLNGLFAIGLAVRAGAIEGSLRVQIHGLSGEPVNSLIPLPSEISETSLQNAMQAVATLKAKMSDSRVYIVPQMLPE